MVSINQNLQQVRKAISNAERLAQRKPGSVKLLAVSKTKSAAAIAEAYLAGQRHFAESYLQEALNKQRQLGHYHISWHFIGPIQSNKTRPIATHFNWVHSVDRFKIAKRLNEQRPPHLPPLNICLQVNISDESSKSGIELGDLATLVEQIQAQLPRLNLRGVMAIPARTSQLQQQRAPYRQLKQAVESLGLSGLDCYSFGMSGDLQAAILEGATMVRIGTAVFGARDSEGTR